MSTCPPAPTAEAMFAVLLPDLQRYVGRVAANVAKRSAVDREDAMQAGLLAVWVECRSGKIGSHASPLGLALRVGKMAVLSAARRADRRVLVTLDTDTQGELLAVEDREPDEFPTLLALIENPTDRRAIAERFGGDRTFTEIGEGMGVTRGAVQQRVGRVLGELRERVG